MTESILEVRQSTPVRWFYRGITLFFAVSMVIAGVLYMVSLPAHIEAFAQLGYPGYLLRILGVAKILGGLAILQNRLPLVKHWAYAGYTFNLLGAAASYVLSGHAASAAVPLILLVLVLASYFDWKRTAQAAVR